MSAQPTASGNAGAVRLTDIDVRYRRAGDGPSVVLVHGLAEDHTTWQRQQHDLTGFRTFAYDLRGHGGTSLGYADGSVSQLRDDLIAFLDKISGPALCVGFSLGGTLVLAAAAERPDLVTGAIVLGTSTVVGRAAAAFYADRIHLARSGDKDQIVEALHEDTAAAITDPSVDVAAITAQRLSAIGSGAGYINAASAMASLRENPLTPVLAAVRCPVEIVGADGDTFCPRKAADIIAEALPSATYQEIPAAGHLMNIDNPSGVTNVVRTALERMS
ncbi:alpha/beta fold hydrolase [Saccharopolyspora sp. NPDC000995]